MISIYVNLFWFQRIQLVILLDVFITSKSNPLKSLVVHPPDVSDHSLIIADLPIIRSKPPAHYATVRGWKKMDREKFRQDLVSSCLCSDPDVWSNASSDEISDIYDRILTELVDKHAPQRTVRKHYRPITPWFNEACRSQKRRTRCFERIYRRKKTQMNRANWLASLRTTQSFYKSAQDAYWQTVVTETSGNAKKLWNTLSAIMGKQSKPAANIDLTAEMFLKSFMDKVDDVRSSTSDSDPPVFTSFSGAPLQTFSILNQMDVVKLIGQAPNKSCARDPLPTWMVKDLADELAPFITVLFNKSISDGYFPRNFRVAEITPILKKTSLDPCVITNYRPISNLSFLSKLLERVINNQLLVHFGENNALARISVSVSCVSFH